MMTIRNLINLLEEKAKEHGEACMVHVRNVEGEYKSINSIGFEQPLKFGRIEKDKTILKLIAN